MQKPRLVHRVVLGATTGGTLLASLALLRAGGLTVLPHDREAARIAEAATLALPVPHRTSRPYWLLRQQPGWLGAHRTDFGGATEDGAVMVIQVARFTDTAAAQAAFAQLTPEYLYQLWRGRMTERPALVSDPVALVGDETMTTEYRPRPSPQEAGPPVPLVVQLILLRTGPTVIVIESLGVPRDHLPPLAAALVSAAQSPTDRQE